MPAFINTLALIVSSYATTVVGANLLYLGTLAAGYAPVSRAAALIWLERAE